MNIEARKNQLLNAIARIKDEEVIALLEKMIIQTDKDYKNLYHLIKPLKKELNIDDLKKEQNFTSFDRAKFDKLCNEIQIEESIEDLLNQL